MTYKAHAYFVLFTVLITCLASCVSVPSSNTIQITPEISYRLTPPPPPLIATSFSQLVEIDYSGKKQRFIAQVEYREQEIAVVAVSTSGVPLFDFTWHHGQTVLVNQYVPLPGLDINYIIADMQWIHWPIATLKQSLVGKDITITEHYQEQSDDWQRMLIQGKRIIYKIIKTKNSYQLEHSQRNYRIKITDLSTEDV